MKIKKERKSKKKNPSVTILYISMALVVLGIPTFKFYTLQAVNCKILERIHKVLRESNLSIRFKLFTIRLFFKL